MMLDAAMKLLHTLIDEEKLNGTNDISIGLREALSTYIELHLRLATNILEKEFDDDRAGFTSAER